MILVAKRMIKKGDEISNNYGIHHNNLVSFVLKQSFYEGIYLMDIASVNQRWMQLGLLGMYQCDRLGNLTSDFFIFGFNISIEINQLFKLDFCWIFRQQSNEKHLFLKVTNSSAPAMLVKMIIHSCQTWTRSYHQNCPSSSIHCCHTISVISKQGNWTKQKWPVQSFWPNWSRLI